MYAISQPPSLSSQQYCSVAYAIVVCVASLSVGMATGRVLATQMSPRVVETQYGKVRGVLVTLSNRNLPQIESYLGIQYASLLGGELRFMPPTSTMEKWDGIRVALKYRPVCPQRLPSVEELEAAMPRSRVEHFLRLYPFLERQQEDCLSLNIYVPLRERTADQGTHPPSSSSPPSQAPHLLPVLVFIHGESYSIGSGNAYDGSVMAAYSQIVVVTLNYRLGALGFLTTGDSNAPGNYALLDVVAALRWIQENIRPFGGNSSDVTLVGQGHGAVMANLLLLSPITRGRHLFHRVILQSGSALSPWAIVADPLASTHRLAEALNCSGGGHQWGARTTPLVQCLKDAPYQDILASSSSSSVDRTPSPPAGGDPLSASFGPTVDHRSVVSADVRTLVGSRAVESAFSAVPLVVGFTAAEGLSHLAQSVLDGLGLDLDALRSSVAGLVERVFRHHRQTIFEILLHQYRDWERPSDPQSNLASLVDLLGDALYAVPALEMALYHSAATKGTTTFVYCFNYSQSDVTGHSFPGHGSDLVYLFGGPISDGIDPFHGAYSRSEKAFSEVLLQYLNQFIRTGSFNDPTQFYQRGRSKVGGRFVSANLPELIEWPPFDPKGQEILLMELRPQVRRQFRASHLSLWLNLIPKIHRSKDLDVCHHLSRSSRDHPSSSSASSASSSAESSYFDGGTVAPPCEGLNTLRSSSSTRGSTPTPGSIPAISGFARTSFFPEISKNQRTLAPAPTTNSSPSSSAIRRDKWDHVTSTEQTTAAAASRGPSNRQQTASSTNINDYRLSLCVVIATGCVLLLMNVLMLSCVYCRKVKALRGQGQGQGKQAFLAVGAADDRSCEAMARFNRIADLPSSLTLPPPRITPLPPPVPPPAVQNHHGVVPPSCPQRSVSLPKAPKEPEHLDHGSMIS